MAEIQVSPEEKAINNQPDNFRWTIEGRTFIKNDLLTEIKKKSPLGIKFISLITGNIGNLEKNGVSNTLGKRYKCLVCDSEVLATKVGPGRIWCCGQPMTVQEPKPIPSSD